ncbi:MAG: flagellar biosynthesis anti-sigma factor FlgM [Acidobacteriaceae bacterium]|nr:flagellar biosynthesis anti-sigma factor FlgM [Acidobacteriaceae bacterium]
MRDDDANGDGRDSRNTTEPIDPNERSAERQMRIDEIRRRVRDGTYQIDASALSKKLIEKGILR